MFGVRLIQSLFLFSALLSLLSCAQPRYENARPTLQVASSNCPNQLSRSGLCLNWQWEKVPTLEDVGSLVVQVYRIDPQTRVAQLTSPGPEFELVLEMPLMKHGSTPITIENLGPGLYRANEVYFNMTGDWELRFFFKTVEGLDDKVFVPFHF